MYIHTAVSSSKCHKKDFYEVDLNIKCELVGSPQREQGSVHHSIEIIE
jgi:hypothetical protein